jgi:hypothetical protein
MALRVMFLLHAHGVVFPTAVTPEIRYCISGVATILRCTGHRLMQLVKNSYAFTLLLPEGHLHLKFNLISQMKGAKNQAIYLSHAFKR